MEQIRNIIQNNTKSYKIMHDSYNNITEYKNGSHLRTSRGGSVRARARTRACTRARTRARARARDAKVEGQAYGCTQQGEEAKGQASTAASAASAQGIAKSETSGRAYAHHFARTFRAHVRRAPWPHGSSDGAATGGSCASSPRSLQSISVVIVK
jgi:hypothetical protein